MYVSPVMDSDDQVEGSFMGCLANIEARPAKHSLSYSARIVGQNVLIKDLLCAREQ